MQFSGGKRGHRHKVQVGNRLRDIDKDKNGAKKSKLYLSLLFVFLFPGRHRSYRQLIPKLWKHYSCSRWAWTTVNARHWFNQSVCFPFGPYTHMSRHLCVISQPKPKCVRTYVIRIYIFRVRALFFFTVLADPTFWVSKGERKRKEGNGLSGFSFLVPGGGTASTPKLGSKLGSAGVARFASRCCIVKLVTCQVKWNPQLNFENSHIEIFE